MATSAERDVVLQTLNTLVAEGGARRRNRPEPLSAKAVDACESAQRPLRSPGKNRPRRKAGAGPSLEVIRVPSWLEDPKLDWLIHGFSTRSGGKTIVYRPGKKPTESGDLNLGFTASDDRTIVEANRRLFVRAVCGGRRSLPLITLKQIHSSLSRKISAEGPGTGVVRPATLCGDGLMTDVPGVLLGIQTADCIPILIADKKNRAVAAFHAGWKGTLARIVESGVGRMRLEFGSKPENMVAAIGPGIGQCCYSVGDEVRQEFESQFRYAEELFREVSASDPVKEKYPMLFLTARAPGHSNLGPSLHLDLAEANRRQLIAAGVKSQLIYLTGECTGCQINRFFSHRVEKGFTGRLMSVIGIRPSE